MASQPRSAPVVFAFGGFIVPGVGWFVGVVMWLVRFMPVDGVATERNPLLPTAFDLWTSGILIVFLLIPIIGGWLLWRLRRR